MGIVISLLATGIVVFGLYLGSTLGENNWGWRLVNRIRAMFGKGEV